MEEFIRNTVEQIRCAKVREYIAKELSDHILDQAAAYEENGENCEEAVRRAVREMGDPVEIGVELDRVHRPQTDYKLVAMTVLFSLAGLAVLYTVGGLSQVPDMLARQCCVLLVSFGVMAGIYFLDYSFIGRHAYTVYGGMVGLFLANEAFFPVSYGRVPDVFMLVYLFIPVYVGVVFKMRGGGYSAVIKGIVLELFTVAVAYQFTRLMHAALVVYLICMLLLVAAIWKGWFEVDKKAAAALVICVLAVVPAVLAAVWLFASEGTFLFVERLRGYLNPTAHASGAGYIYQYIRAQLAAAKPFGASWSSQYLVENSLGAPYVSRTEPFILLNIVCSYGIFAGLTLVLALAAFMIHAFWIVRRQRNQLGFMLSAACLLVFAVNCAEGVLVNTGRYPVTSIQLPFVSYGTGTTLTYAVFIGLLLSIHRHEKIVCFQS